MKGITGISDRRAQKIIKIREESPLTLADLKMMSDIPNITWDPLIQMMSDIPNITWDPLIQMMSDIPNITWDPLIQNGEVTLEQEEDYRAEKGKVIELMSSGQERIKTLERYNAELKAEFCILQKQNTLMQAEFEQKLIEMSVDFKIKIKNQIQEFDKLQEATEKKTDKKYRDC
jgi:hypothetical protein